jgi:hypothetical protein
MNNSKLLKHLYARAGFGLRFEDAKELGNVSVKHAVKELFKPSEANPINIIQGRTDYGLVIKGDVLVRQIVKKNHKKETVPFAL